jgi:16S rRNA (guanine527-N7)-methyltransferase
VTLLESNQKKTAFMQQAVIELALANADVAHARVEAWQAPRAYDVVISRAFSDLAEFVRLAGKHVAPGGVLAAMKGTYPDDEIARIPAPYRVAEARTLNVPGLGAERHLVMLKRD